MKNKVILITGASSGIGAELARQLDQRGAKLILAARRVEQLQTVAATCQDAIAVPTDITDQAACQRLIEQSIAHFGRLDILINNAGLSMRGRIDELDDFSIYDKLMQVNLMGAVYCTRATLPYLKQAGGQVVAISSLAGKTGVPYRSGYVASKHAMHGFFETLRVELHGSGVAVTIIAPGFVDTDRSGALRSADPARQTASQETRKGVLPVDQAVAQMIPAIEKRQRELVMGWRGKLLMVGKVIAPGLVDWLTRRSVGL